MKSLKRNLAIMLAGILLLLCGGCGDSSNVFDDNTSSSTASNKAKGIEKPAALSDAAGNKSTETCHVTVYYPNENADKLIPVTITVSTGNKYAAAVERLIDGKPPKGAVTVFPKNTKVNSVKLSGNTATVDFSQELVKNFSGGSASEIMLASSLADTLTEFNEIETVRISVDGKLIDTLSGHLDLSEPIGRNAELIKK